jgi:hypothetical protein
MGKPKKVKKTDHIVITLSSIKWDRDGQRNLGLPRKMEIPLPLNDSYEKSLSDLNEEAIDIASGLTGWCILAASFSQITIKKL